MEMLKPPPPLNIDGNVAEEFRRWKKRYLLYLIASGAQERLDNDQKVALLLYIIGEQAYLIYETFELSDEDSKNPDRILESFEKYFTRKKNETVLRHQFFSREKRTDESVDEFITALRTLSIDCGFENLRDSLIRDQIIRGLKDSSLKERLLKEDNLDLTKCTIICQATELAEIEMKKMSMTSNRKVNVVQNTEEEGELSINEEGGGGGKNDSDYTKMMTLSPELAALVGQDTMARHEVVKKVWSIIKEKDLCDPENKQYAICDDALMKVIGVKRFRTFGMMEYLKDHFVS